MSGSATKSGTRLSALDGVRGIAILMVLSFHWIFASLPGWNSPDLLPWESIVRRCLMLNWTGVDLFFVLSGFLIGGIVLDNRDAPNFFRVFYARRALRIFPLYFLLLALFVFLSNSIAWQNVPGLDVVFRDPGPLTYYAAFLQNLITFQSVKYGNLFLGNTWSLAIEEQFYLLFPMLALLLPRRWLPYALCVGIGCAIVIRIFIFYEVPNGPEVDYSFIFCRMDALLIGVLCAWAVRDPSARSMIERNISMLKIGTVLLGAALAFALIVIRRTSGSNDILVSSFGFTAIAAFYAAFILVAYLSPPKILSSRVLTQFGGWAYCLYLVHRPMGQIVHSLLLGRSESIADLPGLSATLISLVLVILVAALSWRFFERPLLRIGHRWRYREAPADYSAGTVLRSSI